MIEIQELCKYYGQSRAIGPVSAKIEKGEVIGLLGLNGAGKTTTLRILACDLLPTSGTVKVQGVDVGLLFDTSSRFANVHTWFLQTKRVLNRG